jgi:glycyl-tRNA synthetase beta chain
VAALADKIDSLGAFFAIGEKPTGSRDPFALRRAALGTIRLIIENGLRLPLAATFERARQGLAPGLADPTGKLLDFIAERLKVHMRERGVRHDLIAAAFAQLGTTEDDLVRLLARVEALAGFVATEDGTNLLVAYRRASNIVAIEERRDSCSYDDPVDPSAFRQPEEKNLYQRLNAMRASLEVYFATEYFDRAMGRLATLRRPVDEFFDRVTVNADEPELRANRLRLLSRIRSTMNQVADFSQIEG